MSEKRMTTVQILKNFFEGLKVTELKGISKVDRDQMAREIKSL